MKYICGRCEKSCSQVYAGLDKKTWVCSKCNYDEWKDAQDAEDNTLDT